MWLRSRYIFIFVLLIGTLLRVLNLGVPALWTDELATWYFATAKSVAEWREKFANSTEPFPGGYYFFYYLWVQLFGDTESALRWPSTLASILSMPAMYFVSRRFVGRTEALLTLGFVAFCYHHIFMAQDARPYSLMFLMSCLFGAAVKGLTDALSNKRAFKRSDLFLFGLSSIVITQVHYFGIMLVGLGSSALLAVFLKEKRFPPAAVWFSWALCLALLLPWLPRLLQHLSHSPANITIRDRSTWNMITNFFRYSLFDQDLGSFFITPYLQVFLAAGLIAFLILSLRGKVPCAWLLVCWIVVPFALVAIKSGLSQPVYRARYLVIILPALYIAVATGLIWILRQRKLAAVGAMVVSVLLLNHSVFDREYYAHMAQRPLRGVFQKIEKQMAEDPAHQVWTCFMLPDLAEYYVRESQVLKQANTDRDVCKEPGNIAGLERKVAVLFFHMPVPADFDQKMLAAGFVKTVAEDVLTHSLRWYERRKVPRTFLLFGASDPQATSR